MNKHGGFSEEWNHGIPQEIPSMPTCVSWRVSKTSSFILPESCILSTKAASPVFCTFLQSHEASAPGCSHACFDLLEFPFLSCSILHQIFHLEKVCVLGSINTALEKKIANITFISCRSNQQQWNNGYFSDYITCITFKSGKSSHRKKVLKKVVMMTNISQH